MKTVDPRCKPIPPEALEMISDVLLASSPGDGDSPTLEEGQLSRKMRRGRSADTLFELAAAETRVFGSRESDTLPVRLTPRQRLVWAMHEDGYCPSEIAAALGTSRPTVMRILRNTAGAICKTPKTASGVLEVYRAEIGRKGYRKPNHCAEEPCRKLGYCKYAYARVS